MKTLDEVIKANECCNHGEPDSRCEDCPYNGMGACCLERESDALHYLKEYREHLKWQAYEEHCLAEDKKKIKQAYEQGLQIISNALESRILRNGGMNERFQ